MSLTNKQKKWIKENQKTKSLKRLANDLNLEKNEIEEYVKSITTLVNKPKSIFYFILILIPILFFIFLELSLKAFDYGKNLSPFITLSNDYKDYLFVNPDLPYRYATNMVTPPAVTLDAFKAKKSAETFRVFVMGGSSTAGFPYAYNVTFPRYISRKLKLLYPNKNFEIINLGITAHNSYTINDLADDVIEQKPDLVLVYAGHNEYYGILGVGSTASYGNSRLLTKIMIELNQLKTYQLITNIVSYSTQVFNQKKNTNSNETLMSKMIGESNILFESDLYWSGIKQFELNMEEFLDKLNRNGLKVILGELVSNNMQKPFISVSSGKNKNADSLFNSGIEFLNQNKISEAKINLSIAKENDVLRFRAPENINLVINKLGNNFNYPVVALDSIFESNSPNKIIGYNLMVDHLHPNIKGYNLIGESFFQEMEKQKYLPNHSILNYDSKKIDSLMISTFPFTKLDSVVSVNRIKKLISSYPFVQKEIASKQKLKLKATSFIDSIAINILNKKISWRLGHQEVAEWYYKKKDYASFINEVNVIIENQPYVEVPYVFAISRLINDKKYKEALLYLEKLKDLNPSAYSYKWIGSIALNMKDYIKAINNLKKSIKFNNQDAQVFYNLSGAYFNINNLDESIIAIRNCLSIKSNYPNAKEFELSLNKIKINRMKNSN